MVCAVILQLLLSNPTLGIDAFDGSSPRVTPTALGPCLVAQIRRRTCGYRVPHDF